MSEEHREVAADWMMLLGGLVLFASLFMTWSHQFSRSFLAVFGGSTALQGVPHNPTAWQVYSAADVVLALVAAAIVAVALVGNLPARLLALAAAVGALVFTVHALNAPPTNGANIFNPAYGVPQLAPNSPAPGVGEAVAIVALGLAIAGLLLSFTAD